ncbi:hypothetical protein GOBAR_AA21129 [Gossypium barbadense]|uniref:Dolichyl-diphosphooligosaccharide--protein glycosyltransferase subunit 3 n=1 Tax=Gossypium barbadense TaxID=3634 RepID=A0A2P5X8A9_GOSBA|nr:hypothetical protein GOBAR_AA21129 [Gossypium barbadense]
MMFKKACGKNIRLQDETYGSLLKAMSQVGRIDEAINMYQTMLKRGIKVKDSCYCAFANVLCKEDQSGDGYGLLVNIMKQGHHPCPSQLSKYIASLCRRKKWKKAEELLNLMLKKGLLPDSVPCCLLMEYYCFNREMDKVVALHYEMVKVEGSLDVTTYNTILEGLWREKKAEEAVGVFDYMTGLNLVNSASFTIMICELCRMKEMRKAMKIHDEMLKMGFKPDKSSGGLESELVADLLTLQAESKSGVIHLDDRTVSKFLTSPRTPRPYSFLIFFDAANFHDKPELRLRELRREFEIVASSFITNHNSSNTKLFFGDIEFRESQSSFQLFGVNSLPHVRLVGPTAKSLKDDSDVMDQGDFSRLAESMAEFVQYRTKLTVGPIHRPPALSKMQLGLITALLLLCLPLVAKRIFAGETLLHDPKIWLSGAFFVYFFSVSGAMHNIIRKMPMFLVDRNNPNKLVFFYQGSGMQLGAEGFAVGFLYTVVGLLLAFVTHVLVYVKDATAKRLAMLFTLLVSFWAVKKVILLDNWKTGYGIHGFWPSSWN